MRIRVARVACAVAWLVVAGCATTRAPKPAPQSPPAPRASRPAARTVADVLETLGPAAERRLRARFAAAGVDYPPPRVHLLAFKAERRLELWVNGIGRPRRVTTYPLLADSGVAGPKLREGDEQIPEGIYRIVWLHPNSSYHLSMKLDYPSEYDRARAREDGRTGLGGDIFIHGKDVSIGCLAIGDPAIEELFVLAARIGIERMTTVIAPWDLRRRPAPEPGGGRPSWVGDLYGRIGARLAAFR